MSHDTSIPDSTSSGPMHTPPKSAGLSTRGLVVIHGFTGRPESWAAVLRRIDRPSVSVELPGHSLPADPSAGFEGAVRTVRDQIPASLLEAGYDLAGYSLGGRLALGLAVRWPQGIRSLLLIGSHPGLERAGDRARRAAEDDALADRLQAEGLDAFVSAWRAAPLFASQARLPESVRDRQDTLRRRNTARGLAGSLRQMGLGRMPCYLADLPELPMPTTLAVGALDRKFHALAETMAARIPRSRLVVISDAGHNLVLERPEAVAQLLTAPGSEGP